MNKLNIIILAGGRGTRLQSVWDGPKCLVPVKKDGTSLLRVIYNHVLWQLVPNDIIVSVGYKAPEVIRHAIRWPLVRFVEDTSKDQGTGDSVSRCLRSAPAETTVVLNGDTIQNFSLRALVEYSFSNRAYPTAAWHPHSKVFTGAAVIHRTPEIFHADFWVWMKMVGANLYIPPMFIDAGTPEGLEFTRTFLGEE